MKINGIPVTIFYGLPSYSLNSLLPGSMSILNRLAPACYEAPVTEIFMVLQKFYK
jgi:hypothetical protein